MSQPIEPRVVEWAYRLAIGTLQEDTEQSAAIFEEIYHHPRPCLSTAARDAQPRPSEHAAR
jgi:hypothetical protein